MKTITDPLSLLPQKYPFLLIDSILEFKENEKLIALKNVTGNEWIGQGERPFVSFPKALFIETCAQAALLFYKLTFSSSQERIFLAGVKAEFFNEVFVGDQICLEVSGFKHAGNKGFADVTGYVNLVKKAEVKIFYGVISK